MILPTFVTPPTPVTPFGVFVPQILLTTKLVATGVVTGAEIVVCGFAMGADGNLVATDVCGTISIPDVLNPPEDLVSLGTQFTDVYNAFLALVGNINGIRKVA